MEDTMQKDGQQDGQQSRNREREIIHTGLWVVSGMRYAPGDCDAMYECALTDPLVQTVTICALIIVDGVPKTGRTIWTANGDRLGYVDPEMGEREYRETLQTANEMVAWHNARMVRR